MQKNIQINKQDILFKELSSVFLDSFSIDNLIDKIDIKILIKKKKKLLKKVKCTLLVGCTSLGDQNYLN